MEDPGFLGPSGGGLLEVSNPKGPCSSIVHRSQSGSHIYIYIHPFGPQKILYSYMDPWGSEVDTSMFLSSYRRVAEVKMHTQGSGPWSRRGQPQEAVAVCFLLQAPPAESLNSFTSPFGFLSKYLQALKPLHSLSPHPLPGA